MKVRDFCVQILKSKSSMDIGYAYPSGWEGGIRNISRGMDAVKFRVVCIKLSDQGIDKILDNEITDELLNEDIPVLDYQMKFISETNISINKPLKYVESDNLELSGYELEYVILVNESNEKE